MLPSIVGLVLSMSIIVLCLEVRSFHFHVVLVLIVKVIDEMVKMDKVGMTCFSDTIYAVLVRNIAKICPQLTAT
jgi:hypothetical protein